MLLLIDDLLSLISPHICKGCGRVGSTYCPRCIFRTIRQTCPICLHCGGLCKTNNLCLICRRVDKVFTDLRVVAKRTGSIKHLVGDYKYNSELASCRVIAKLMSSKMADLAKDTVIVPVPTAPIHIRQRGFDHMLMIARELSRQTGLSMNTKILQRADNIIQHQLRKADRHRLIERSLQLSNSPAVPDKVLLLDDIWTTGATMSRAGRLLRQAGVKQLTGLVVLVQPH